MKAYRCDICGELYGGEPPLAEQASEVEVEVWDNSGSMLERVQVRLAIKKKSAINYVYAEICRACRAKAVAQLAIKLKQGSA